MKRIDKGGTPFAVLILSYVAPIFKQLGGSVGFRLILKQASASMGRNVLLMLYVIMHSMIADLKVDLGICKAMGFTSSQLITQTAGSITPVVLLGAVLSTGLGTAYLPAMFNGIFGVIGAVKNNALGKLRERSSC